jgi:hypothetical protein
MIIGKSHDRYCTLGGISSALCSEAAVLAGEYAWPKVGGGLRLTLFCEEVVVRPDIDDTDMAKKRAM